MKMLFNLHSEVLITIVIYLSIMASTWCYFKDLT